MRKESKILAGGLAAVLLAGCAAMQSGAPPVTAAMASAAAAQGESVESLVAGRRLLATRCISCHGLEPIASRSPAQWNAVVDKMAPRAGLESTEATKVRAYLAAASASISQQ